MKDIAIKELLSDDKFAEAMTKRGYPMTPRTVREYSKAYSGMGLPAVRWGRRIVGWDLEAGLEWARSRLRTDNPRRAA
jgi:hypothetical protein